MGCGKVESASEITAQNQEAMTDDFDESEYSNLQESYEEEIEIPEEEIVEIDTIEEVNEYIIAEQTFDVCLEDWGDVKFVSCVPGYYDFTDASFFLLGNEQIVYKFPHRFEDNCLRGFKGVIAEVGAVSFGDVNYDDKADIIIISYYVSGIGSAGMLPRAYVTIYLAGENEFYVAEDMIEEVEENIEEKDITIESVYNYLMDRG